MWRLLLLLHVLPDGFEGRNALELPQTGTDFFSVGLQIPASGFRFTEKQCFDGVSVYLEP
ncbi:hypothetical protein [Thioalkalivibrio nitratireducens]|uniref:hypothetical protein n=1 Tax=Thioalkalivibrio nitratireducens TaxID=186931 RepID=UPI0002F796C7|nr:hypothetical protein [Thioalkalivibrio nitratireducens]